MLQNMWNKYTLTRNGGRHLRLANEVVVETIKFEFSYMGLLHFLFR